MENKVAIIKCGTYDDGKVYLAVKESVDLLGGLNSFVKPGMRVLVKPNLLSAVAPERAVTTHPSVVKAVIRLVKEAKGTPFLGDCHGGVLTGTEVLLAETKMTEAAAEAGAEIINLEKLGSELHEGIAISKGIKEFDLIINVCKFKTHGLTILTGAVKNSFGMIPGMHKASMHRLYPEVNDFCEMLLKVSGFVNPALSIMDGVIGMEGDGPIGGNPKSIGLILAAKVPLSLDFVMAKIAGIDPLALPVLSLAIKKGFKPEEIKIVGEPLSEVILKDFKPPYTFAVLGTAKKYGFTGKIKTFLQPFLWKLVTIKPVIDNSKCQKCNECVKACPVKAIGYDKGFPRVDNKICIECYCCHELCRYKAVAFKKNLLVKIWLKRQNPKK
ncbi:MAG: hypothetical protein A2452_06935 [Candidatus Firestonebacteria bacterium RIFOXYC2_FULL_39_67]|nr:MAG: hypothetical protein A2536_04640 [Candidatus Firestonebacteria bacterium RIFOXYD2_FULL_39_29]OGF55565.1 MAG: hypothetical protein A2452_06935 [Candidatus Firestonebacteria bacterium RIFOXYC2_FULL_39_67]